MEYTITSMLPHAHGIQWLTSRRVERIPVSLFTSFLGVLEELRGEYLQEGKRCHVGSYSGTLEVCIRENGCRNHEKGEIGLSWIHSDL